MEKPEISLLFVEDDVVLQNVYKYTLTKIVDKLYFANNGKEGYQLYKKYRPQIIVTDIRMPVINGLDMARNIKMLDKNVRIILVSAFMEPRYFMQAIELGVKSFIMKPIDAEKLKSVINEQVEDIFLEWKFQKEEERRRKAEEATLKSETILKTLVDASASFFHYGFNSISVLPTLKNLGEATKSSRVYIFENKKENNGYFTKLLFEWTAKGVKKRINDKVYNDVSLSTELIADWVEKLSKGENVVSLTRNVKNDTLRKNLEKYGVLSILMIPIFVNDEWWGFVGIDDQKTERIWTDVEIKALEAMANNLGAAIYRRNVELELLRMNALLEERVKQRTRDLEVEVAERKVAEMLLRDSEEKYRLIFENANSSILLIREGIITLVNPKTVDIFNYFPKVMIGNKLSALVNEKYKQIIVDCFEKNEYHEKCASFDVVIETADGKSKWVEIKSNKIVWDNVDSYLLFISDITARKDAEYKLNMLNKSLEERIKEKVEDIKLQQQLLMQKSKLESMGELSAGLAHELNQPLVGISMALDNIMMKVSEDNFVDIKYLHNKFKYVFDDIERINRIIQHVRLFSREQEFNLNEKVNVNEVIENALSMMEMQMKNHSIFVDLQLSDEPLLIEGNQYRLEQVIVNLLSNAKYALGEKRKMLKGSNYKMSIAIKSSVKNNRVVIEVTDNGTGIDRGVITKIFNPFFTTKSGKEGTGLGLSISYGIIKEMKGSIAVKSEKGNYTTFVIELPKA